MDRRTIGYDTMMMGGTTDSPQTREVTPEEKVAFRNVLAEAMDIVEGEGAPYLAAGSIASTHWGRPSTIGDIDLLVDPTDAKRLLKAFDAAGYDTEETESNWLYKATKDDVTVDLIFEMEETMHLDEPMLRHGSIQGVEGTVVRLMSAEDFIVSQAMSMGEDTPDYWYNALGVLSRTGLDWDYLIERAKRGPRRVLSLLIYAQSTDLIIPESAIRRLYDMVYGR
jgi:hypothetical protein